ncbi:hypothetical protein K3495_g10935 [Podosphaera aphanis]|nr:hypothetical protein K3495_g10935 [Podosphaera aphanis]
MALEDDKTNELLTRWIVDPGSNTHVINTRARAMRIQGNLPKSLANEIYKTVAYILNRTPTEALGWKTKFEMIWGRKPLVAHMRLIEFQAYAQNHNIKKTDKTESRALIGHLAGYQGTIIFRVWLPIQDEIIITRDVIFDPLQFFDKTNIYAQISVV